MVDELTEIKEIQARYFGFLADQARLERKLSEIDIQREDTRKQLERVRRIVAELGAMCGVISENNLNAMGFTDACRTVLRKAHPEYLSQKDIKDKLEEGGFDLSRYESPAASIYTILGRLEEKKFAEKKTEGWNVLYRWKKSERRLTRVKARAIRQEVDKQMKE